MTFITSETDNLSCIFKFLAVVKISSNVRRLFFPHHRPKQSKFCWQTHPIIIIIIIIIIIGG